MSLKLSELKKLHDKGLALIWLRPSSKRPWEKNWTQGPRHSWELLENSFEKTNNVGVRLGEPSRLPGGGYLGVIDCDVKSKSREAIKEMNTKLRELGLDLDSAPIVMSGRGNGSKHVYISTKSHQRGFNLARSERIVKVAMPGETRPHSKREMKRLTQEERAAGMRLRPAWEISFMGDGQQVVLPPSVHPDSGMKYDWASPLSVKYLPQFPVKKFMANRVEKEHEGAEGLDFKAEDVDLWGSTLKPDIIELITDGRGCEDRSASLMRAAMAMCRAGFHDNAILSVLSDPNHYLAQAAYDRRRGRKSAVEWLYKHTLLKARHETSVMRYFDNPPSKDERTRVAPKKARAQAEVLTDEALRELNRDGKGNPKPTMKNVVTILEHHLGGSLVGLNEFSNRAMFLQQTPYSGVRGQEVSDHHDRALKHYLATNFGFEPATTTCFEAHQLVAHKHRFHPVREYLHTLEWDGKPRLDDWLKHTFKVSGPHEYIKAVSRKVLVAAVKRVMEPGCKFDHVLVLEGNQGEKKSLSLSVLVGREWFTDSLGDIHNKDVVDQMTGKWVIELSELASVRGRENEHIKQFLSSQVDRVRMAYGRRSEDYPRQSIFIGSTNAQEYFNDETGNRRFWPVRITQRGDAQWVEENRDQLWAEAVVRYELGEPLYLSDEVEVIARKEQEKRFEVDEWEPAIRAYVEKHDEPYITADVWRAINSLSDIMNYPDLLAARRVGKIMHRLGYKRSKTRIDGVQSKCWVKT